ncbi:MAG: hypothetical protein HY077_17410 [Elusimicrobia bacterium]|nr:hypothetical protein [Elusimicrobiota bacterium]
MRLALRAGGPVLAVVLALGCAREFRVSGTITVAAHLQSKVPRTNSVLFVVAKNAGGVPVAVRRVVNPQFPVDYELRSEDLIVPGGEPAGPLILEVEMNTHGNVGAPVKGDLRGAHPDKVFSGERGVHIVIDREI